jgi:hypothetical protein
MQLPEQAVRALDVVRRDGRGVRYEIRKACEQDRWRLKVCYRTSKGGGEVQVGLAWSDDLEGLEALKRSLEEERG